MTSSTWDLVHAERLALLDDFEGLSPNSWEQASLCEGWTVHDVLAHLVDNAKTTKVSFAAGLLLARFDFDRLNQRGVRRERQADPVATLDRFRSAAARVTGPPAPVGSRLVEEIVHGEDIRRPLGIDRSYPVEALTKALDYQVKTSDSVGGSAGLVSCTRLVATDADWAFGTGPETEGSLLSLLLLATGRVAAVDL